MDKKYKYSIIIPHHNIPSLLERCLKSIPRRKDIQIIIVDDNSSNINFESFPGFGEPNIETIFSKKGTGAGGARNEGLNLALGEWLIFIDADDFLQSNALEIWDSSVSSDFDIIYFNANCLDEITLHPSDHLQKRTKTINRLKSNQKHFHRWLRFCVTEPWGKLFNRKFIIDNNIKFQESLVANDYYFSVLSGLKANRIHFSDQKFYNYLIRHGSLSNNQLDTPNKIISRLNVYFEIQNIFIQNNINIRPFYRFLNLVLKTKALPPQTIHKYIQSLGLILSDVKLEIIKSHLSVLNMRICEFFKLPYCGF